MSASQRSAAGGKLRAQAPIFAALGDETRLALVAKLCGGGASSISQLTAGSKMTRQAVSKHLRVLQRAGIVHNFRAGRENLFKFDPRPITGAVDYLRLISAQWDDALQRLKNYLER